MALLAAYSGPEPDRVTLGVLKAADCNIEKMRWLLALAEDDWRELLCEAEYPLSSPGNPYLPGKVRVKLELIDEHRFDNGMIHVRYRAKS